MTLKLVGNHKASKPAIVEKKPAKKEEKTFKVTYIEHTRSELDASFKNPLLYVDVLNGKVIIDNLYKVNLGG